MKKIKILSISMLFFASGSVFALTPPADCPITWPQAKQALDLAQGQSDANGGFGLDMWITIVNKDGRVCAVYKTGDKLNDQWTMSRVISMTKANTAVSLANNGGSSGAAANPSGFAFTTAGLFMAVQPGSPLYTLHQVNPVDTTFAYAGDSSDYGTLSDPAIGHRIGGVNTFGGGLALFNANNQVIGALGVSGDASCTDHNIAMRVRGHMVALGWAQGPGLEVGIDYPGGYPDCLGNGGSEAFYNSNIAGIPQRF